MWDDLEEEDDGWQPVRTRRAGTIRVLALLIAAAMVIALVLPVLVRLLRSDGSEQEVPQGERAAAEITRLVQ